MKSRMRRLMGAVMVGGLLVAATPLVRALADKFVNDTTLINVSVTGGADTVNPGTSCIQTASPPLPVCTGGWVAIPANNKQLIAAALAAKSSNARVTVYYDEATATQHCPGFGFTPCQVISIAVK